MKAASRGHAQGRGDVSRPYTSLAEVEAASQPGDTIYVLPSHEALDGGIQLKNRQRLIGIGTQISKVFPNVPHAQITNSTNAHLSGDGIRLANNNTVSNIHVIGAYRGGILGINVASPVIEGNLITENMNQHSVQELQEDFIIFQAQRNHYGAITLFACGTASPNECQDEDPATVGVASHHAVIRGNVINDVAVEAIIILNDRGVVASYDIRYNSVDGVSLQYPGFLRTDLLPPVTAEVVRSRAFTALVGNGAHTTVNIDHFDATHLAPSGDWASDGIVFVSFGDGAVITANVTHVSVTNPDFTGETVNGDSLEMTAFGSNSTFDVRVRDTVLSDSVSTLVKLLEVGSVNGNSYILDVADSVFSNVNPRVATEGSQGAIAYFKIAAAGAVETNTVDISVRNTQLTGHRRGLLIQNLNSVHLGTLNVFAENTTFSNSTNEGFRIFNQAGVIDHATIDLGGGALGSAGRNTFINNGTTADADVTVVNTNSSSEPLVVYVSQDYWGGEAPVTGAGANLFASGPATFVVNGFLTQDPN